MFPQEREFSDAPTHLCRIVRPYEYPSPLVHYHEGETVDMTVWVKTSTAGVNKIRLLRRHSLYHWIWCRLITSYPKKRRSKITQDIWTDGHNLLYRCVVTSKNILMAYFGIWEYICIIYYGTLRFRLSLSVLLAAPSWTEIITSIYKLNFKGIDIVPNKILIASHWPSLLHTTLKLI